MFVRLADTVLHGRELDRRGGDALPDSYAGSGPSNTATHRSGRPIPDPTGAAAVRRITGDVPRDIVHERTVDAERALARVAARLQAERRAALMRLHPAFVGADGNPVAAA